MECILDEVGDVACAHVELGHANAAFRPSPLRDVVQLAAGDSFVCALDRAGSVRCSGKDPCSGYGDADAFAFEAGAAEAWRALRSTVAIVDLRAVEGTILMRGADQRIYVAGLHEPVSRCANVVPKDVPSVRSFVHLWAHGECSLDAGGATTCRSLTTSDAPARTLALPGFPAKAVALVSGQSTHEGGPVLCAIGAAGELTCSGVDGAFASGAAVRIAVPPVRDAMIGSMSLRVLTTAGEVYDLSLRKTPPPARAACTHAPASLPTKVKIDEPVVAITSGSCMLTQSAKTVCVRPGCN